MRRVERIQRRLQAVQPDGGPRHVSMRDMAELEARVRALRSLGRPFDHVALSRHVTCAEDRGVLAGAGGEYVATEV